MPEADPLKILSAIRRLEVGPVALEPRKLSVPYRVVRGGARDETDLVYRFEEDVFDPGDPASVNLAGMMGAQVALNYGLFCEEIVFRGPFDSHDRRFLEEMAQNTAREIFVKKLLEPNPFLVGDAARLGPQKRASYLRAKLRFPDAAGAPRRRGDRPSATEEWKGERSRHAVLSSGGKDSLLSFGLLREIGAEVTPIFVNESGRHWFTALNAYRHFAESVPGTARVWTNTDRLFSWMLRHFPFIRKDFAHVRSDEYPIRLWTVATFLFGALPILRCRGIGRLVIGDEYDTTRRVSHRGIPHYDGLYDQSRYFDNAMTRYFKRKKWGVSQFSILRPLSELLIEKTLVERYGDLQRHQVSCHAAHTEGERVIPCGRCEKCRRIVGMLSAMGADPARCGYSAEMIRECLATLEQKPVHQEAEGALHMVWLLKERGLLPAEAPRAAAAAPRPEVLKLRFDPDRSPLEGIPTDLREPLFRIFREHATGAVKRSGKTWLDFDPLTDPSISRPYLYEGSGPVSGEGGRTTAARRSPTPHLLGTLTWPEAERRLKEVDVALLPVGAVEQHGPHLPLDTDAFDADYLAREVAKACSDPKPLVLPLIPYGVSYHHKDFQGTISVSPETLSRMVYEIGMDAARQGITKLVVINGHGGNGPALHFAAQMINRDAHIFTCVDTGESSDADIGNLTETPNDVHAGEIETSTSLANRPELVDMTAAERFVPEFSIRYLNFSSRRSVGWYAYTSKISPSGVMGDPTRASVEKGEKMWAVMIRNLVDFIEDLKFMSLDELHERRY